MTGFPLSRRRILAGLAASLPFRVQVASAQATRGRKKKGLAGWDADARRALKVSWWYDWGTDGASHDGIGYVPMIKGKGRMGAREFAQVAAHKEAGVKELLGFNEPERGDQGNLGVDEAIEAWPKLEATGLRLGSPVPSSDTKGMDWLARFMEEVGRRKLRVDFIALHWYRSADAGAFEDWLKETYRAYRRPIWLTEFNPWRGHDERTHLQFLRSALRTLERAAFVERYAYFNPSDAGNLFAKDGDPAADGSGPRPLTRLGVLYRDIDQTR